MRDYLQAECQVFVAIYRREKIFLKSRRKSVGEKKENGGVTVRVGGEGEGGR